MAVVLKYLILCILAIFCVKGVVVSYKEYKAKKSIKKEEQQVDQCVDPIESSVVSIDDKDKTID